MNTETSTIFLSYAWGPSSPAYADGGRGEILMVNQIASGSASNSLHFSGSNHFGTHMDFPLHFCMNGRSCTDYPAEEFVYNEIAVFDFQDFPKASLLTPDMLDQYSMTAEVLLRSELVLIRFGSFRYRQHEDYWKNGPGIGSGVASWLRSKLPRCRAIGVDSISITSLPYREVGRQVHRELLCDKKAYTLIEDMDLSSDLVPNIQRIVSLPLRIEQGDGAPATVIGWAPKK